MKKRQKRYLKDILSHKWLSLLFNFIYLIIDGIFIGIRLGRDSMAVAAISVPVIEILLSIAMAVQEQAF